MMIGLNKLILFLVLFNSGTIALAESRVNIKSVRIESFNILSHSYGSSLTSMVSLRPTFYELDNIVLGASLGYAYAHSSKNDPVNVFESTFSLEYWISAGLGIVLDVGGQYWSFKNENIGFASSIGIVTKKIKEKFEYIDSIYFGYGLVDQSNNYHLLRAGIGFKF